MSDVLKATAFRGDPDIDDLHSFFQPERHFVDDTLWTFGTSLKSAYVDTFEFMNHAPVVELWRDEAGAVQAVSRLSLGTGEWFHQAAPDYRHNEFTSQFIRQADAAFELLTDHQSWRTVRYQSSTVDSELLKRSGYVADGIDEVFMIRPLDEPIEATAVPPGFQVRLLTETDADELAARAEAQIDAFSDSEPTPRESAWIARSLPHQLSYGRPGLEPNVIALDADDSIVAFADVFLDRKNKVGEFEPVGTRKSGRRLGLSKAVMSRGLQEMQDAGMHYAVVRTGYDNTAAIAAYESVGFQTTDLLISFRKAR
ncbi:MAG: GNAT family N-acetyltransferase [Acidimicrobiales bacterium]